MDAGDGAPGDFDTYEDYLDSQITETDLYYLEDGELARQLVVRAMALGEPLTAEAEAGAGSAAVGWRWRWNTAHCDERALGAWPRSTAACAQRAEHRCARRRKLPTLGQATLAHAPTAPTVLPSVRAGARLPRLRRDAETR